MYLDGFDSKEDIANNFHVSKDEMEGIRILFAAYKNEDYNGQAVVVFEKEGKLYEVNGSHCSCYGLEDQWTPEETSVEALKLRDYSSYSSELQANLERFLVDYFFEKEVLLN